MAPLDIVTTTSPQLNSAGAVPYFHPDTLAAGKEIGLDGFRFYVLGRGGVLGDVEPALVGSAFGYFAPGLVAKMWNSAKERVAPREAARAYNACAEAVGRSMLADVDGLTEFNDAAEAAIAGVDVAGLALFAGYASEPLPDDAPGRAMRNVMTLREWRGSLHLLTIVAVGLSPAVAHAIRRPGDVAAFGWDPAPEVAESDRVALSAADTMTDELMVPVFAGLSDGQRDAFVAGAAAIHAAVTG